MAIDIEIETLLLDDEDLLARGIDVLQLNDGQRIETAPSPTQRTRPSMNHLDR